MTRLIVIAVVVAVALMVYAAIDAILIDRLRVRGVPKGLWVFIIIVIPVVGPILWFLVGRGKKFSGKPRRGPSAPDDDIDFLRGLKFPPADEDPSSPKSPRE